MLPPPLVDYITFVPLQSTVERQVMPQIKSAVLRYVAQPERDEQISNQCDLFSDVTLDQLRVKTELQSSELVPFIDSITQLRLVAFHCIRKKH